MAFEDMMKAVGGLGDQLRWGADLEAPSLPTSNSVIVCGMGGSGMSGDLAARTAPQTMVMVSKGYGLPSWSTALKPLVVAVSYSGNTEETLSAVEAAGELGLPVAAAASGGDLARIAAERGWPFLAIPAGMQPRAAVGYLTAAVCKFLAGAGVVSDPKPQLEEAAALVDEIVADGSPSWGLVSDLADGLEGRVVIIYGSEGLTAPVAQRWKTQLNENAKWPAWWSLFPELDHNEVVGWTSLSELTRRKVGIVVLREDGESSRMAARFRHTAGLVQDNVLWAGEVWARGDSPLARMMSLVAVGDVFSLELARRAGIDPLPVTVIEELKKRLAEEPT